MTNLPTPVGWAEVATRTDLAAPGDCARGDVSALRSHVSCEMAVFRAEMRAARAELLFKMFFAMVMNNAILVILVLAVVKLA